MEHVDVEQAVQVQALPRNEYEIVVDGVIAIPEHYSSKEFFDGLFDAILEYAEKYDARAALSIAHQEYVETV